MGGSEQSRGLGFTELLLAGVVLFSATLIAAGVAMYVLPREPLQVPELQPSVRVAAESDFPVGASRVVNWGDQIILVVRRDEDRFLAVEGLSQGDGCILRWDAESLRVVSPCSHLVFDLRGNVVAGLTTTPLLRYAVFRRNGLVYVTGT